MSTLETNLGFPGMSSRLLSSWIANAQQVPVHAEKDNEDAAKIV
jgi:hypothetical protein